MKDKDREIVAIAADILQCRVPHEDFERTVTGEIPLDIIIQDRNPVLSNVRIELTGNPSHSTRINALIRILLRIVIDDNIPEMRIGLHQDRFLFLGDGGLHHDICKPLVPDPLNLHIGIWFNNPVTFQGGKGRFFREIGNLLGLDGFRYNRAILYLVRDGNRIVLFSSTLGGSQAPSECRLLMVFTDNPAATRVTKLRPIMAGRESSMNITMKAEIKAAAVTADKDITPSHEGSARIPRKCS